MIGTTLSHYRVVAALGAGGMGEVYRATDERLGRDVAIKVLPKEVASDADRLARFRREAHVLAALNHPHIGAIHGLEEVDGKLFLVLELVEGETLAQRLARGPLSVDEALPVAKQIAEALEEAHEKGIVHRDLKPANVKLSPDGRVKVLDFGLAKACADEAGASPDLSHSPTLTQQGTEAGAILGTAAYMSPEQAKGQPVDKRTDVWAFGVVLFEVLSGVRLHGRPTPSETLASVIRDEPDWSRLPRQAPVKVRELLRRCLTKDPKRRLRDIGEARIAIEDAIAHPEAEAAPAPSSVSRALAALAGAAAGAAAIWMLRPAPTSPPVVRIAQTLPRDHVTSFLTLRSRNKLSLSPDGARLVYVANRRLYLRPRDALEAVELPGTEGATGPFFSPDGQWVGFFAGTQLKRTRVTGGAPLSIATLDGTDGAWAPNDTILVAGGAKSGILKVPAGGGTPEVLVASESGFECRRPQVLPGGRAFLYVRGRLGNWADGEVVVRSLKADAEATVVLKRASHVWYVPTGHLVYGLQGTLSAVAFDLEARRSVGDPVTLAENLDWSVAGGVTQFALSDTGLLAYVPASESELEIGRLVAVTRSGAASALRLQAHAYADPRISPDGNHVAARLLSDLHDVWVADPTRGTLTRLSDNPNEDETPAWSPDGGSIVWAAARADVTRGVYRRASDGSGSEELLWQTDLHAHVTDWSRDGKAIFFRGEGAVQEALFVAGSRPTAGVPHALFPDKFESPQPEGHTSYDVWPDGRFLMIEAPERQHGSARAPSQVVFVLNFFEELKARVRAEPR